MRKLIVIFTLIAFFQWPATAQYEIELEIFARGLNIPTTIAHDGSDRLFITEKGGRIRILESNGELVNDPFLDISDRVRSNGGEQGLLGLAFHPDHNVNGYLYVNYTRSDAATVVSRFTRDPVDSDQVDPSTEQVLLTIPQPFSNHNGGDLHFGPDGYLYISSGDGGSGGDPQDNGQERENLLGKILRIDVDNGDPYAIPPDNPFVNDPNTLDEIWSLGLRNPWRFSFDRQTGDMWIGDVGQGNWEEVDWEPAGSPGGLNYGWRCYEGYAAFNTSGCGDPSEYTFPVHVYRNNRFGDGCSVTGGYVYRGQEYPIMFGDYIYADFCSGKFWALRPETDTTFVNEEIGDFGSNQFGALGEDVSGNLYAGALSQGIIYRITLPCWLSYDIVVQDETCSGVSDGSISLDLIDQTGEVGYEWSTGDSTNAVDGLDPGVYYVTVSDGSCSLVDSIEIMEGVEIEKPVILQQDSIVVGPGGFSEYIWTINGEEVNTGSDSTISIMGREGQYSLVVVDANGCESPSSDIINVMTGNSQDFLIGQLMIHPNPVDDMLWITIPENAGQGLLTIFDSQGREVYQSTLETSGDPVSILLDSWRNGNYFIRYNTRIGFFTAKFVKTD